MARGLKALRLSSSTRASNHSFSLLVTSHFVDIRDPLSKPRGSLEKSSVRCCLDSGDVGAGSSRDNESWLNAGKRRRPSLKS